MPDLPMEPTLRRKDVSLVAMRILVGRASAFARPPPVKHAVPQQRGGLVLQSQLDHLVQILAVGRSSSELNNRAIAVAGTKPHTVLTFCKTGTTRRTDDRRMRNTSPLACRVHLEQSDSHHNHDRISLFTFSNSRPERCSRSISMEEGRFIWWWCKNP